jgi:hypothetical protein
VPYLTIQKELVVSESAEFKRIKEENQTLQAEIVRHVVEREELQELRAEIEHMKSKAEYLIHPTSGLSQVLDERFKKERRRLKEQQLKEDSS